MLIKTVGLFLCLLSLNTFAQGTIKKFSTLSSPEKWWVFTHPFKAKKAFYITNDVLKITDSISQTNLLNNDINGGQLDAFKHSYWLARLSLIIGEKAALKLGEAHEKGNYQAYKKMQMEDGLVPDKIATTMDLFNNKAGVNIAIKNESLTNHQLAQLVVNEINNGSMRIIKKDDNGNFLTCDGLVIPRKSLMGTWENNKCLLASNRK